MPHQGANDPKPTDRDLTIGQQAFAPRRAIAPAPLPEDAASLLAARVYGPRATPAASVASAAVVVDDASLQIAARAYAVRASAVGLASSAVTADDASLQLAGRAFALHPAAAAVGGSGGLINWTETLSTASLNSGVNVASFVVKSTVGTANVDAVFGTKGAGSILAQIPDGLTTGGNKRAASAVDLQLSRSASTQVCTSPNGFLGNGRNNELSMTGLGNVLVGGDGQTMTGAGSRSFMGSGTNTMTGSCTYSQIVCGLSCTITPFFYSSANYASAGGRSCATQADYAYTYGFGCTANGLNSQVRGLNATDRGVTGADVFASVNRTAQGDNQRFEVIPRCTTTDAATVTPLVSDALAASTSNQILMPTTSVLKVRGQVVGRNNTNGQAVGFDISALLKNVAGTVSVVGTPVVTQIAADATMTGTTCTVTADNTNKTLAVSVTGVAATTVHWSAELTAVQGA